MSAHVLTREDLLLQDRELRRLQAAHEVQLRAMHSELHHVSELMASNAILKDDLERAARTATHLKVGGMYALSFWLHRELG